VSPAKLADDGSLIEENDLAMAMRGLGAEQRGWQAETRSVRCQNCNAISVFDAKRVAQRCDFCGSPAIVPVEEQSGPDPPFEPAAVQGSGRAGPGTDAALVRDAVVRAQQTQGACGHGYRSRRLSSLLDLRRPGVARIGPPSPVITTT
jgi:hypothetical protein